MAFTGILLIFMWLVLVASLVLSITSVVLLCKLNAKQDQINKKLNEKDNQQ